MIKPRIFDAYLELEKILLIGILQKTLMITAFVAVMMLLVEYFNVQTRGVVLRALGGSRWRQYLVAALLGAVPGCLGAYAVVALFIHRKVTLGALVATMIATSGDETFVMLALFPKTAVLLTLGLALVALLAGWLTDRLIPAQLLSGNLESCQFEIHDQEDCECFPYGKILAQWQAPSPYRVTLVVGILLVILALSTGQVGPALWGWKRITLLLVMAFGLFVSSTVPEHFLEEHLWRHVAQRHVPRVFLWTLGVLVGLAVLVHFVDLGTLISTNKWTALVVAGLVGVLPESGPHLVFVTTYAEGLVPLSILVASSVVQDGHGMLPLLSSSKRVFIAVKLINLAVGYAVGATLLAFGW